MFSSHFPQELDIDVYALRFIPKENGVHYVSVKLKEAHIPGSPFPMLIGKMGADPALVLAQGDGLVKGETGANVDWLYLSPIIFILFFILLLFYYCIIIIIFILYYILLLFYYYTIIIIFILYYINHSCDKLQIIYCF